MADVLQLQQRRHLRLVSDRCLGRGELDAVRTSWHAYQQTDTAGLTYALAGQIVGDKAYVMVIKTDRPGVSVENAALLRALYSIKIAGKDEIGIESYADVEALVQEDVNRLTGSSISIAVVHQGEIVYTYAYGQATPVAGIPADTQTIYQCGSMTKVVTASALMYPVEKGPWIWISGPVSMSQDFLSAGM